MFKIFVGTGPKWYGHHPVLEHSIKANATIETEVHFVDPPEWGMANTGCTGFTNARWAVPELAGGGWALYLDVDMLVLGDVRELWDLRARGAAVICEDGSSEVMVIDCSTPYGLPPRGQLHRHHKSALQRMVPTLRRIPPEWNVEDSYHPGAKLVHFTDLRRQPWDTPERTGPDIEVLNEWQQRAESSGALRPGVEISGV